MSEERDLFSCRKPLVRSGGNKIQVRVLCLPTIIAVSSVAAENERIPPYNCVLQGGNNGAFAHVRCANAAVRI